MATEKQIAANRLNALKSTGPKTEEGKSASSLNNTRHGLFSTDFLIEGEDIAAFEALASAMFEEFQPANYTESSYVHIMVQCRWRQMRLWALEAGSLTDQIRVSSQNPEISAKSPNIQAANAWTKVATGDGGFRHLNRVEVSLDRMYARTLKIFHDQREKSRISVRSQF